MLFVLLFKKQNAGGSREMEWMERRILPPSRVQVAWEDAVGGILESKEEEKKTQTKSVREMLKGHIKRERIVPPLQRFLHDWSSSGRGNRQGIPRQLKTTTRRNIMTKLFWIYSTKQSPRYVGSSNKNLKAVIVFFSPSAWNVNNPWCTSEIRVKNYARFKLLIHFYADVLVKKKKKIKLPKVLGCKKRDVIQQRNLLMQITNDGRLPDSA